MFSMCILKNLGFKKDIVKTCTDLYERKNKDYGDSFSKSFKKYGSAMPLIRLEDKLNRLERLLNNKAEVLDESIEDTLIDIINYSVMTLMEI